MASSQPNPFLLLTRYSACMPVKFLRAPASLPVPSGPREFQLCAWGVQAFLEKKYFKCFNSDFSSFRWYISIANKVGLPLLLGGLKQDKIFKIQYTVWKVRTGLWYSKFNTIHWCKWLIFPNEHGGIGLFQLYRGWNLQILQEENQLNQLVLFWNLRILINNVVRGQHGHLRTFGGIKLECDLFNGRPKAQCYPFNIDGHRFRDKNPQVPIMSYTISYTISHRIVIFCGTKKYGIWKGFR